MSAPIDLEELLRAAEAEGESAVVSRSWLKRVHEELSAARDAADRLGEVFGRRRI
ncbi:MAG: hypothetical protein V2I27_04720 [Erythrobacter sp.]|jgi:hypothetical protein|nr:hypothetical protein [Erythrobacter sp.]